jgi:hypothetical protein
MVVQLFILVALKAGVDVDSLVATMLAVEAAVHNFLCHERFTWADRTGGGLGTLPQIQFDYGSVFPHRKPGVDEGTRRSGAHELSVG